MAQGATLVKRENIPELSVLRAIAIIGVLTVHCTSVAVSTGMIDSNWFFLYNFANIFLKFGTTTFIFLSSFVLFYNYYHRPFTKKLVVKFYQRRLLYIIIPYIVFSLFYYFIKLYGVASLPPINEMISQITARLLRGNAHAHLYFVFISVQFYLMFPIFLWILKKFPKLTLGLIFFGIAAQWAFFIINKFYLPEPVTARGSWSLSYFSYYFLGAYLGIHWEKCKNWLMIGKENFTKQRLAGWLTLGIVWLMAGLTHVYIWHQMRLKLGKYNTSFIDAVWNLHALTTAVVLLMLSFIIYRHTAGVVRNLLVRLGELSFGIYLFHPFVLLIYRKFPAQSGNISLHHLWYVGGFAAALIISWIVVTLTARFFPQHWILFGNIPNKKRKQAQANQQSSRGVEL
jgi:peptidoglycan/LPS O-acetylase OafA/YrhL